MAFSSVSTSSYISAQKDLLVEICNAVNERQEEIGRTQSTWLVANGTRKTKPSGSDFVGSKGIEQLLVDMIDTARNAIEAMIIASGGASDNYFCRSNGNTWSKSSLLTAAGYGSNWTTKGAISTTGKTCIEELQDVLAELIYYFIIPTIPGAYVNRKAGTSGGVGSSAQDAWDDALADTGTDTGIVGDPEPFSSWHIERSIVFGFTQYSCALFEDNGYEIDMSGYSGSVHNVVSEYGTRNDSEIDVDFSTDGGTISTSAGEGFSTHTKTNSAGWTLGVNSCGVNFSTARPSSQPFGTIDPDTLEAVSISVNSHKFIIDISSLLTYG